MATLRGIHIDAPSDFAANLDLYVSGEKRALDPSFSLFVDGFSPLYSARPAK